MFPSLLTDSHISIHKTCLLSVYLIDTAYIVIFFILTTTYWVSKKKQKKLIKKKSLCAVSAEANSERNLYNPPKRSDIKLPPPPLEALFTALSCVLSK